MTITPEVVVELKAKYIGRTLKLRTVGGEDFVLTVPTRETWQKFKADCVDERKRLQAAEGLLRAHCVWPDAAALDAALCARPALADRLADQVVEIAGMEEQIEKKDL